MGSRGYDFESDDEDEGSRLLQSVPPRKIRTSSIRDGQEHVGVEPPVVYRSRWRSIRVMYLTMFLSSVSFSICMSSIFPYLQILDTSANTDFLGWVVAAYSLGQLIASPLFGAWANWRKKSREPLLVSLAINVAANILYIYLESIPSSKSLLLVVARISIGFGAGNVAVVRSYVSGATTMEERTPAMANMSACQAIGFIIGPLIQTTMVPIGYPGLLHEASFHLDMYTAPALLSAAVGIMNIVLLLVVFHEHFIHALPLVANIQESGNSYNDDDGEDGEDYSPDRLAVLSSIFLFFVILFVFAVFETIATPLSMHMFAWKKAQATLNVGFMLGGAGIVSIIVFVIIKKCSKVVNERYLLLVGFVFCLVGFIVYLPWGHHYPDIQYADLQHSDLIPTSKPLNNGSQPTMVSPTLTPSENTTAEAVGCPYVYSWCYNTPAVLFVQFILGTLCIAIGYPTCNVMSYTIYSKILGPRPQGIWMGWLTAAGSAARTLGPVFVSQVYDATGPRWTFLSMAVIVAMATGFFIFVFKRLVPFKRDTSVNV